MFDAQVETEPENIYLSAVGRSSDIQIMNWIMDMHADDG